MTDKTKRTTNATFVDDITRHVQDHQRKHAKKLKLKKAVGLTFNRNLEQVRRATRQRDDEGVVREKTLDGRVGADRSMKQPGKAARSGRPSADEDVEGFTGLPAEAPGLERTAGTAKKIRLEKHWFTKSAWPLLRGALRHGGQLYSVEIEPPMSHTLSALPTKANVEVYRRWFKRHAAKLSQSGQAFAIGALGTKRARLRPFVGETYMVSLSVIVAAKVSQNVDMRRELKSVFAGQRGWTAEISAIVDREQLQERLDLIALHGGGSRSGRKTGVPKSGGTFAPYNGKPVWLYSRMQRNGGKLVMIRRRRVRP